MFSDSIYQYVITNNIGKDPPIINPRSMDKFNRNKFLDKHKSNC